MMTRTAVKRKKPRFFQIAALVMILMGIGFGICSARNAYVYRKFDREYEEVAEEYAKVIPASEPSPQGISAENTTDSPEEEEIPMFSFPVEVDFDALLKKDPHVVGWLYVPDTQINYPVLQGTDNIHYLNHGMNGDSNGYGAIFLDAANSPTFDDPNTVFYGHHMNNGSMFAAVAEYKNQEFYESHPVMWLATPGQNYRVDIYSCYVTKPDAPAYTLRFADTERYAMWMKETVDSSLIFAEVMPNVSVRTVTLSTCSYEFSDARCVAHGILVPLG